MTHEIFGDQVMTQEGRKGMGSSVGSDCFCKHKALHRLQGIPVQATGNQAVNHTCICMGPPAPLDALEHAPSFECGKSQIPEKSWGWDCGGAAPPPFLLSCRSKFCCLAKSAHIQRCCTHVGGCVPS